MQVSHLPGWMWYGGNEWDAVQVFEEHLSKKMGSIWSQSSKGWRVPLQMHIFVEGCDGSAIRNFWLWTFEINLPVSWRRLIVRMVFGVVEV